MADNIVTRLFRGLGTNRVNLAEPVPVAPAPAPRVSKREVGVQGEQLIRSMGAGLANTLIREEIRQDNLKITDYRRMFDNDGQVQMLVNAVFNTILSAGIEIQDDPDYESDTDSEQKQFIEKNLLSPRWKGGMEISLDMVNRMQLRAFIEGYRVFEIIYRIDPDGKIYLKKLAPRAGGDDFQMKLLVDTSGNFMGYKQRLSFAGKAIDISLINDGSIRKVHRVAFGDEFGSLYGRSGLRAAWYHYDKAHKGLYLNHVGHELGVIKPRIIYTMGPTTEDQRSKILAAFDRIHMESSIMLPKESYEVEFPQTTDAAVMTEGRESINMHYSLMAKSLLAQFVDLGSTMSSTGSRSLGESQIDFFKIGLMSIAKTLIEEPWNEMIADIIKINFGDSLYPTLKVKPIDDNKAKLIYDMLLEMSKKGDVPDVFKNKVIAIGADTVGIEVTEEEIAQEMEQKKQEDQQAAQQEFQNQMAMVDAKGKQQPMGKKMPKQNLSEDDHEMMHEPMQEEEKVRPLYLDEQKVKFGDIKAKLEDSRLRAEYILRTKLSEEKDKIIALFVSSLREGRKSLRKVDISLSEQDSSYRQELIGISHDLFEFGKRSVANEMLQSIPVTPKKEIIAIEERTNAVVDEQEQRLKLNLTMVANDALDSNMPENDAKLMLEQEYDGYWDKVLIPSIGMIISKMFNKGRGLTFDKYQDQIFAYRYTAILDARTTQYCRDLDGKVFQPNDPNYALLTPPNHFGCRSFWTEILVSESAGVEVNGKPFNFPVYSSVATFKDV